MRGNDVFGGYASSVTDDDIALIKTIPRPRCDHKEKLRELFFPEKDKDPVFFDPVPPKMFGRVIK